MSKYNLLPKQKEFMEIPHTFERDIAIYQGGFGSGKTWCGSLLGILLAKKYAGSRGLVGAKEYELVRKTTLVKYLEHLERMGYVRNKHFTYNKVNKIIEFKNGSQILFSGLDDEDKIKSLDLHWAEVEEASQLKDSSIKQLLGRLRNTYRKPDWGDFQYRLFMHTNPSPSKSWIYVRFVEQKKSNWRLITAPTTQNIFLPSDYAESMKDDFDPEYYKINVLGEFGDYSSGLVVKNFSDKNILPLKYNNEFPLHLTCDFNVDPMCWYIAFTDTKKVFVIDEIVIENTTTRQTAEEFCRRYPKHKGDIIINGDASGDYRSTQSERTNYKIIEQVLTEHGYKKEKIKFHLRSFNPPIASRVHAFNAKVCNAKGDIGLYIDKDKCPRLLNNIYNLKYKEGTSIIDVPTHHQIKKDRESKFLMHPYDALSYLVEYYWAIK